MREKKQKRTSSSETDDSADDDFSGSDDDIYGDKYDDLLHLDDANHLTPLSGSLSSTVKADNNSIPTADQFAADNIQSAFGVSSHLYSDGLPSVPLFNDSIRSYIEAPSLSQTSTNLSPYYLSIDPIADQSTSNLLASDKLFVGNVAYTASWHDIKEFFVKLGYSVIRVDLPNSQTRKGHRGCAFVRFDSERTAENVLCQFEESSRKFVLSGRQLKIGRYKKPRQQMKTITTASLLFNNNTPGVVSFSIGNVYYGTFIMGAAINTIADTHTADGFVLIAHLLVTEKHNTSVLLNIDQQNRKVSIMVSYESSTMFGSSTKYTFEWNFGALKGEKISPVLINDWSVGLLIEVKQPPLILHSHSSPLKNEVYDTRMPGTPLIGRANAWLFQLNGQNIANDYIKLFQILRRYNLAPRRFFEDHILRLIRPPQVARECLRHVQILSNDKWINENREIVSRFFDYRWPQYPFETKFEIMKLLSKHIITVHDLIIDEQFDRILAQCSFSTFIACTDKIVEFAPRWLHDTCDHEDEDWDDDEQSQRTEDQPPVTNLTEDVSVDAENISSVVVHSAIGTSIDATNTEPVFATSNITRFNVSVQKHRLGYPSRFLLLALKQLRNKHELRQTTIDGIYVTKHELHTINFKAFLIRKVYITPSTILYEGPYREEKCLVTRHFEQQQEGFLRVTFRDEDYGKLQYTNADMSKLYDRIKVILMNGIGVCDRHYDFLAFSSSQLREHCCWMFSPMNNVTANSIREWIGEFQNIRPVAKMAARLGQSFSTTRKGLELSSHQYKLISDVKLGKSCFTDGIGIISPWLAEQLCKELRIDRDICHPCAFQIRFGGFKGMVCLDVARRITSADIGLYLRPSMNKFDSKNLSVDIVRVSSMPSTGFLNRQIILVLSSLNIRDEIFHSMQEQMLDHLRALIVDHRKAREFLKQFGESSGNGYHGFLLEYLKRSGNRIDPFARQILIALQVFHVKELRTKARIIVPNTWSLFGVIDETRTLQYEEVFIQIERKTDSDEIVSKIITGPVIVTRHPCFHPGDIRRLNAIDVPDLHQLKNVIVFPMNGKQSHPAEMAGGDLDGDTFWVSQEPRFLFNNNEDPFDYHDQAMEDAKQIQMDANATYGINDVCRFFVEYIEADNLGPIANSHLAFADQSPYRVKAKECLQLARMHSTAVDFAKNGVSAQRLMSEFRPSKYPHFMENKYKQGYHSETILGQLYDEVKRFEIDLFQQKQQNIIDTSSFPYNTLVIDGSDAFMTAASTTKNEYDLELKRVMRQYGIQSEAELVSGYILKFTTKQYAKQTKTFELRNEIGHAVKLIQDKYLRIFYEEIYHHANDADPLVENFQWSDVSKKLTWKNQLDWFLYYNKIDITNDSEIIKKASAWFRVTYDRIYKQMKMIKKNKEQNKKQKIEMANDQQQSREKFHPLLSFAWIVYPILMKIYDDKQESKNME